MDDSPRQVPGPGRLDRVKVAVQLVPQAHLHGVDPIPGAFQKRPPGPDAERVFPPTREIRARQMHLRQGAANARAMIGRHPPWPQARQEGDDRRRPAAEGAKRLAVPRPHGQRTGHAAGGQMIKQTDEERQVTGIDPFFIECQDVSPRRHGQKKVGILDAFGDALEGDDLAQVVGGHKFDQFLVRDFRVDSHGGNIFELRAANADAFGLLGAGP